jgi:hypothetical protein
MSSSKQVAAAVIILNECGLFGRKRTNRKRRNMWVKKWLLGREIFTHFNLLNFIKKRQSRRLQKMLENVR